MTVLNSSPPCAPKQEVQAKRDYAERAADGYDALDWAGQRAE